MRRGPPGPKAEQDLEGPATPACSEAEGKGAGQWLYYWPPLAALRYSPSSRLRNSLDPQVQPRPPKMEHL